MVIDDLGAWQGPCNPDELAGRIEGAKTPITLGGYPEN